MFELSALLQAFILGVIQGITEFVPVSSSAHLVLLPYFGNFEYLGKTFDVALHGGTLLALFLAMPCEIKKVCHGLLDFLRGRPSEDPYARLGPYIIAASVPAAAAGFFLEYKAEAWFHSPLSIAVMLSLFGILLYLSDKAGSRLSLGKCRLKNIMAVGFAQVLALVPGVSRSGITMTASRLIGLPRGEAVRLSFLLGVPVIGGAFAVKLCKGFDLPDPHVLPLYIVGISASLVSGMLACRFMLEASERLTFKPFALYRVILGIAIACMFFWHA